MKKTGTTILFLFLIVITYLLSTFNVEQRSLIASTLWSNVSFAANFAFFVTAIFTLVVVILENRDPMSTTSWVIVLLFFPVIGIIAYIYFGRDFRKEKLFSRKGMEDFQTLEKLNTLQTISLPGERMLANKKLQQKLNMMKLLMNNSKALLSKNNHVQILNNGEATFSSLIGALEEAQYHIHLEYYIIKNDRLGNRIKDILIEKAHKGLEVRLIYDDVGSWALGKKFVKKLKRAGVDVQVFMPVRFPLFTSKLNYRNHRKIAVVDGKTGFVGGLNIGDEYLYGHPKYGFWRDTHLRLEGEAVHCLQAVFLTDWYFVSREIIKDHKYFPKQYVEEEHLVQITTSGPDSDWSSMMQAYFSSITGAYQYLYIATPFLIPNESILTALKTAALSGVDVRILLPGKNYPPVAAWSTRSYVEPLLRAGVKVYEYQKGLLHSKVMVVDDIFASVGSANMDVRSFDHNFEVNALVYDQEIANELKGTFMDDLKDSKLLELHEYVKRPVINKIKESLARLLAPIL